MSSRKGDAGEEFHAQAVVEIVVEVRAGGNDPVHETGLHQGDDGGGAETGGGQRAGERQADGAFVGEHLVREEAAGFPEAGGVVGLEGGVDQVGDSGVFFDRRGQEAGELFVERGHGKGGRRKDQKFCLWSADSWKDA